MTAADLKRVSVVMGHFPEGYRWLKCAGAYGGLAVTLEEHGSADRSGYLHAEAIAQAKLDSLRLKQSLPHGRTTGGGQ